MYKRVHCIGIGGIGLSALARYYMDRGAVVSGSDVADSELLQDLRDEGMEIFIGHMASNVPDDVDLVIYTIAIEKDSNEEYIKAKKMQDAFGVTSSLGGRIEEGPVLGLGEGPALLSYPAALGELTKSKKTIAICGTHGKTTTTAMTYYALKEAGINATMIVGSLIELDGKKTNYVYGDSEYLIIEACEYRRSFLNYNPTYILVTNIDTDHLDYYKDLEDIQSAFREFANKLPESGRVICHEEDALSLTSPSFGEGPLNADTVINHLDIKLKVIGEHNQKNAQLVVALGEALGLDRNKILRGLENFLGTWRRMEYRGYAPNGALVYDDYAHHPREIEATLTALNTHYNSTPTPALPQGEGATQKFERIRISPLPLREGQGVGVNKKIVLVFQPHLQSRTHAFYNEFIKALSLADIIYVLPIYHARAEDDLGMSNIKMVASILGLAKRENKYKEAYTLDFSNAKNELAKYDKNHIIITMGAGRNNIIADQLVAEN